MRLLEFEPLACGGSNACQYDLGPGWKRCQAAQVSGDHCSIRDPPDLGTVFAKCARSVRALLRFPRAAADDNL